MVLDALRRGEPYGRWLLVFDNADQPELIRGLMAADHGDIIVTSRNRGWSEAVDALEVDVFTRAESKEFLGRGVTGGSQAVNRYGATLACGEAFGMRRRRMPNARARLALAR